MAAATGEREDGAWVLGAMVATGAWELGANEVGAWVLGAIVATGA